MTLNPWLALIIGFLLGWLLEWFLELWFFRRRRLESQRRLTQVEGDLRTREAELRTARAQTDLLETDLRALRSQAAAPVAAVDRLAARVETPAMAVELPEVEVAAPALATELPEIELPEIELPKAELPEIELPKVEFSEVEQPKVELPEVELPKIELPEVEIPEVELPKVELPDVDLDSLKGKLTGGLAAAGGLAAGLVGKLGAKADLPEVELPKVELPEVELPMIELPEVELPKVELPEVEMPKVELPEVELPKLDLPEVELPKVELPEVELPKIELPDVDLPEVELPKLDLPEVELPKVELPEVELPKIELPDVDLPEVELPKLDLPEVELPKLDLPEVELPKVELPEVELPKVELPEVELPKLDLPEVELPEVELPKIELPDVDVDSLKGKLAGGLAAAGGLGAGLVGKAELPEVELPDVTAGLPTAEVAWPEISARVGEVSAELPEVSLPRIGAELPAGDVALPQGAVEVLAPAASGFKADDLTLVPGIGPKYAAQLAAGGITSYAALSAAKPEQLRAIIDVPAWRRVDTDAWITGAQTLLSKPPAAHSGDDLTLLEGIGPVYADRLNEAGILSFADLAAADEARLGAIIQAPAWRRVSYGDWIAQARLAAAGDQAGLEALQAVLFSRRGDNLNLVSGVGEKTAQALAASGITTFSALAASHPDQLAEITRAAGVRGGDYNAWIEEARLRASGKRILRAPAAGSMKTVACPQDLSRVKGIGSVYEQKLYAAGIGSFWELAQSDDAALKRIFELKEFQDVDLASIKADALRLAEETGTTGRKWDGTQPDDFEPFEGIGEVYEGRLYDAGICTYRALAHATVEQLAAICQAPDWRKPDYASWIAQAKRLLDREA